jgi:hypothetical protein
MPRPTKLPARSELVIITQLFQAKILKNEKKEPKKTA